MKVGLANLVKQYEDIAPEINHAIIETLHSGRFILGPVVQSLEEEISQYCGADYGVGVNSGTDALILSLLAYDIKPGDEVITTPFTFVATAEAIALIGARPVFADIDPKTFNLDPTEVEKRITSRTRAIIPVDLFGQMADRHGFQALAERHNLHLIWDSAQAIGATYDGKPLGAYPGVVTLSFFPTKNLGAYGDGGMVLTNDVKLRDRLRLLRFHGSGGGYYYDRMGYSSRLDAIQAAVLRVKLKYLSEWNERRIHHACRYRKLLPNHNITHPYCDPLAGHIYHQFTIRHNNRDALQTWLKDQGVETGIYYPLALHVQNAYEYLGYHIGDFPHAELATEEVLSIPVYPEMEDEQLEYVSEAIRSFDP